MPEGSLWRNRVPQGEKEAPPSQSSMPRQKRAPNAAEQAPPKGYAKGIEEAEKANTREVAAMEALAAKMSKKNPGKLTPAELALAAKVDSNPRAAGRLLGRGSDSKVERIRKALQDPGTAVKGAVKGAASKTNERRKKGFWG